MKTIAVLASGRGSNFSAVIDRIQDQTIPAICVALITDNPDARAIDRATEAGIPSVVVDYRAYPDRQAYEVDLFAAIQATGADLIVLAGYMRILGDRIVNACAGRMINIHPALLPSFFGLHAQRQALEYGVRVAGCTVHFVDTGMDSGPIILQQCVPVLEGDDEETLTERILKEEHRILPEAVRLFCEDRLTISGRRVQVRQG